MLKVLVVDDSRVMRRMTTRALQLSGRELANVLVGALVERFGDGGACDIGLPDLHSGQVPLAFSEDTLTCTPLSDSGDLIRVAWTLSSGART